MIHNIICKYVLAHVGTSLTVLDEESAQESIAALTELSKVLEEEERNRPLNLPE